MTQATKTKMAQAPVVEYPPVTLGEIEEEIHEAEFEVRPMKSIEIRQGELDKAILQSEKRIIALEKAIKDEKSLKKALKTEQENLWNEQNLTWFAAWESLTKKEDDID